MVKFTSLSCALAVLAFATAQESGSARPEFSHVPSSFPSAFSPGAFPSGTGRPGHNGHPHHRPTGAVGSDHAHPSGSRPTNSPQHSGFPSGAAPSGPFPSGGTFERRQGEEYAPSDYTKGGDSFSGPPTGSPSGVTGPSDFPYPTGHPHSGAPSDFPKPSGGFPTGGFPGDHSGSAQPSGTFGGPGQSGGFNGQQSGSAPPFPTAAPSFGGPGGAAPSGFQTSVRA